MIVPGNISKNPIRNASEPSNTVRSFRSLLAFNPRLCRFDNKYLQTSCFSLEPTRNSRMCFTPPESTPKATVATKPRHNTTPSNIKTARSIWLRLYCCISSAMVAALRCHRRLTWVFLSPRIFSAGSLSFQI